MKVKQIFISCVLIFTMNLISGKEIDSVRTLLRQKSYSTLQTYLDKVGLRSTNIGIWHELNRQIVAGYSEIWIHYQKSVPDDQPDVSITHPFDIYLLLHDDSIIYCKMENKFKVNSPVIELQFFDQSAIQSLQNVYKNVYGTSVLVSDLFNDSIVYGSRCSWAGTEPPYRVKLNELVKNMDTQTLNQWLCSPVAEIQVYAIDGFHQLHMNGYKLNASQLHLINIIKKKKGLINACGGCYFIPRPIYLATEKFFLRIGFKFHRFYRSNNCMALFS